LSNLLAGVIQSEKPHAFGKLRKERAMTAIWICTGVVVLALGLAAGWVLAWLRRFDPLDFLRDSTDPGQFGTFGTDPMPRMSAAPLVQAPTHGVLERRR
jgi:hypothetical protein